MLVPSLHSLTTSTSALHSGAVTLDADLIERDLPIVISAIDCTGSEDNITSCAFTTAEDESNCDTAYVVCQGIYVTVANVLLIMAHTVSCLYLDSLLAPYSLQIFQLCMITALMETYVWLVAMERYWKMKAEWRCASTMPGEQCVTIYLMVTMLMLCAHNWGLHLEVSLNVPVIHLSE